MNKHVFDKPRSGGTTGRARPYLTLAKRAQPGANTLRLRQRPLTRDDARRLMACLRIARNRFA